MNATTTTSCWAIEHIKGRFLRGDNAVGYELYTTREAAQNAIDDSRMKNARPIKVNIKIEGAHLWSMKTNTKKRTTSARLAAGQAKECMTVQPVTNAKVQALNQ
jgi:hypothetical protein